MRHWWIALALGCGGDGDGDPLSNEDDVVAWANSSSTMGAYELVREPLAIADGEPAFADPACPTITDDGTTVTITGECTDSMSHAWTGIASVVRGTTGGHTIDLDGFGNDAFLGAVRTTGTATTTDPNLGRRAFQINAVTSGGVTTTVVYSGTIEGGYDAPTTWNGSGTVTKEGDFFNGGTIDAATVDQVRDDDACPGEGFSGSTTLTSEGHIVVITYDGDTACDAAHAAKWSRDGKDLGTIDGITCRAGGGDAGLIGFAVCGLLLRRRRSSTSS